MATESLIRMMEARTQWHSRKEAAAFPASANMTFDAEDLIAKDQMYPRSRGIIPNRSGSAPPSMEGSIAALKHMNRNSHLRSGWASLSSDPGIRCTEEQLLTMPSSAQEHNFCVKVKQNVASGFHRRLSSVNISDAGNNWRSHSFDDSSSHLLNVSQATLATHDEESEDDTSPQPDHPQTYRRNDRRSSGCPEKHLIHGRVEIQSEGDCPAVPPTEKSFPVSVGEAADLKAQEACVSHAVKSSFAEDDRRPSSFQKEEHKGMEVTKTNEANRADSVVADVQFGVEALNISEGTAFNNHKSQQAMQYGHQNNFILHNTYQQNNNFHYQYSVPQIYSQGVNNAFIDTNQALHGAKLPSTEVQPLLQSSGFTPPIYATTGSYIPSANAYYSSMQVPGVAYPPHYVSPYAFNAAALSPFLAGYPPHSAVPLNFEGTGGSNFTFRAPGFVSGGSGSHPVDLQHLHKFYGQHGAVQPSVVEPSIQLHQSFGELYNTAGQADSMVLRTGALGSYPDAFICQKSSDLRAFSPNRRPPNQTNAGLSHLNQGRGVSSPVNPVNMGLLMHGTTSYATPVIPAPPSAPSARNQAALTPHTGRNTGFYGGWSGQRGFNNSNYPKAYSFLEELKSGRGRRFELSDIWGHVAEFSIDQHGSRFIQQKLESCNTEEKGLVFSEVLPHASKLMTDVFGNYVIQKFFEYGTPEQRREVANQLAGQILPLSLQMYGCRVIQKALDVIELEQKAELIRELDGHVMRCVRDQNGNHVIQKCIESIPTEKIDFIISAFHGQVANLSMHPYGCRVIQRVLERCKDVPQTRFIAEEILVSVFTLAQDQYGNYVTQHVLERGNSVERSEIIKKLCGQIVPLSQHKFASNVIEKCLEYGDSEVRDLLVREVVGVTDGNDNLLVMMKDQYANYVVQKILETCTSNQRDLLLGRISVHLHALRKYTYGKHIVARFEQLFGEEIQAAGSS